MNQFMSTKLIQTQDYLLLIDEEAEIKKGDYILEKELIINIFPNYLTDLDECFKILAYYPLTSEAGELYLPLLPNPFDNETYIKELAQEKWGNVHRTGVLGFIEGYKAAQSKQFSLEDMKEAFNAGGKHIYECEVNGKDKKCYCRNDNDCNQRNYLTAEEYVQSLSTQQLPISFEPEYEYWNYEKEKWEDIINNYSLKGSARRLKTITNSEGKEELVGIYKY